MTDARAASDRLTVALINAASQGSRPHCGDAGSGFGLATIQPTEAKRRCSAEVARCSIHATKSDNINALVPGPASIGRGHQARQHDQQWKGAAFSYGLPGLTCQGIGCAP
jgi:hypothetical protein